MSRPGLFSDRILWFDLKFNSEKGDPVENEFENFDWDIAYTGEESDYEEPDPELVKVIDSLNSGSALDMGCGAGGLVIALARRGWDVTGVDISGNALKSAKLSLDRLGLSAVLQKGDSRTWNPTGKFDLVVSSFALPNQDDRPGTYRNFIETCTPGGTVLIKEFDSKMNGVMANDLPTEEEFRNAFKTFDIVRLELLETPSHAHGDSDQHLEKWSAILLQAVNRQE